MDASRAPERSQRSLSEEVRQGVRAASDRWRRGIIERALGSIGLVASLATLILVLMLSACAPTIEPELAVVEEEEPDRCIPPALAADAPSVVMISAGGPETPKSAAMREAMESYLGTRVTAVSLSAFDPASLAGAAALVIYGDEIVADERRANMAVDAAQQAEITVIWIGPGAYAANGTLDVTLDDTGVAFDPAPRGSVLVYNGTSVPAAGLLMGEAVTESPAEPMMTLAEYRGPRGTVRAAITIRSDLLHIGFDPLDGFPDSHGLAIAMDAIADMISAHEPDPRVIFRLEDLNPHDYGEGDTALAEVSNYLLSRGVFLHLAVIPEYVDADGTVLGDVGDMPNLRRVVETNPDRVEVIQHGYRHHRADSRNGAMASGAAYEFYFDDDRTMGAAVSAAFARERLNAGRTLMETHLMPVWAFEAPHYQMSPAQEAVADGLYDMIHHPPLHHSGAVNAVRTPWFTIRGETAYAPSSAGYIDIDNAASTDQILERLAVEATLTPDPVAVVFYHPFMWHTPGREEDLERLIDGIESLGYRFVSACETVMEMRQ